MRYKNIEKLGLIESDRVFTKDFQWIFREQPIADVGIDAIIEEVNNYNPTGRLIATQIKTGLGNFHSSNKQLTYYVSNTHYNYWLGYVLPVILIAYLPETDDLLWQIVSKDTLKKTSKKWKIEIPRKNILNTAAKSYLIDILNLRFRYVEKRVPLMGDPLTIDVYSIVQNVNYINDSAKSTLRFVNVLIEIDDTIEIYNQKLNSFLSEGCSENNKRVITVANKFANELNVSAKRIENEIENFTKFFGLGISSYTQASTIYYSLTKNEPVLKETKIGFNAVLKSIIEAENGLRSIQKSIKNFPKAYPKLKAAGNKLVEVLDVVLGEYKVAKEFLNKSLA